MPRPNRTQLVNILETMLPGMVNSMTYAMKSTIPPLKAGGGWNPQFLEAAFGSSKYRDLLVDLATKRLEFVASTGSAIGDIWGIQVRDTVTGVNHFAFSGTELLNGTGPAISTLTYDAQVAVGITWAPGLPYNTTFNNLNNWLGTRLTGLNANQVAFTGQSLGGFFARLRTH